MHIWGTMSNTINQVTDETPVLLGDKPMTFGQFGELAGNCESERFSILRKLEEEGSAKLYGGETLRLARKYRICEWERNGYDDSDFYGAYYDEATGDLHTIEIGSTRYAGGINFGSEYLTPTPEIVEKARLVLAKRIAKALFDNDNNLVMAPEPHEIKKTYEVSLLEPHTYRLPVKEEKPCFKCEGTGKFIRGGREIGVCFACKGTKVLACKTGKYQKGPDGKCIKKTIPAGTIFTCFEEPAFFGTQYKNGYNKPRRFNTTLRVTHEGTKVRLPLEKLRLARDPMTEAEAAAKGEAYSHNYQFGTVCGCTAWLSDNYALAVVENARKAQKEAA